MINRQDEYGLCWYKCEQCGAAFDEFEMNYRAAMKDKKTLCKKCRKKGDG